MLCNFSPVLSSHFGLVKVLLTKANQPLAGHTSVQKELTGHAGFALGRTAESLLTTDNSREVCHCAEDDSFVTKGGPVRDTKRRRDRLKATYSNELESSTGTIIVGNCNACSHS